MITFEELRRVAEALREPTRFRAFLSAHPDWLFAAAVDTRCPLALFARADLGLTQPSARVTELCWFPGSERATVDLPVWAQNFITYVDGQPGDLSGTEALAALDAIIALLRHDAVAV